MHTRVLLRNWRGCVFLTFFFVFFANAFAKAFYFWRTKTMVSRTSLYTGPESFSGQIRGGRIDLSAGERR